MRKLAAFATLATLFGALLIPAQASAQTLNDACEYAEWSAANGEGEFAHYDLVYIGDGDQGSSGSQVIIGTDGEDVIDGESGNDFICGADGYDIIYGGSGADIIYGNRNYDDLYGESGNDTLYGNRGQDDYIYGGSGPDYLNGGRGGDDRCIGDTGPNTFTKCEEFSQPEDGLG